MLECTNLGTAKRSLGPMLPSNALNGSDSRAYGMGAPGRGSGSERRQLLPFQRRFGTQA